jgi:hypothetical protein
LMIRPPPRAARDCTRYVRGDTRKRMRSAAT